MLEYVSLGYLPPFSGGEVRSYRFRLREVRSFAERFLGFTVDDLDSAVDRVERAQPKPRQRKQVTPDTAPPSVATTLTATELASGGFIDFTAHDRTVRDLAEQKDALFAQYGRYREQVGYRVGQLETLLDQEQRRRSLAEEEAKVHEEKAELLKQKLIEARTQLERLVAERHAARHPWWRKLLAGGY